MPCEIQPDVHGYLIHHQLAGHPKQGLEGAL
jgi:hypothetical protein